MYYVYIIKAINFPGKFYVGYTLNLQNRLEAHNHGQSIYTAEHKPWEPVLHLAFNNKSKALEFEKYLKSHSGRAFMQKRLT